MKKAGAIFRVAAVLALVQGLAHGSIILFGGGGRGTEENGVVAVMKAHLFGRNGGSRHSYWDYYIGYAMFAAWSCLLEAALFWIVSRVGRPARPVVGIFAVGNLGYAALVSSFFTLRLPVIFDLAVAACLGLGWWWLGEERVPMHPTEGRRKAAYFLGRQS